MFGHLLPLRRGLTGHFAARNVYGTILVLALLLAVEVHPPGPWRSAALVAGTLLAVLAAEVYAEVLGMEIDRHRPLTREERTQKVRQLGTMVAAGEWPLLFLVGAGMGLITEEQAFNLAELASILLLFGYGFMARRMAGRPVRASLVSASLIGVAGLALAVFKSALH